MIDVEIPLKPITVNMAFKSVPRGRFCTFMKSAVYRQYEKDLSKLLPRNKTIKGEVAVTIEYYLKRYSTTDIDNLTKPLLDCLATAEYFENDKYITSLNLTKYKSDKDRMRIIITEA